MANSKRLCKYHGTRTREYIVVNKMAFCTFESAVKWASENKLIGKRKIEKSIKAKGKARLKELKPRSYWYKIYQMLINQFVVHVIDKDKGCYTCGKTDPSVKYDCGHRHHAGRGGGDRRRFILENLHKQCSMECNQHGGGMPVEYDIALDKQYGKGFAEKLNCIANYPTLKEQFPTTNDIQDAIKRYRVLLKGAGLKPLT